MGTKKLHLAHKDFSKSGFSQEEDGKLLFLIFLLTVRKDLSHF